MKNDLSQGSVAVYTQRRRNKSIWLRSCMIIALVVVLATSYALIFPARTADRALICTEKEHVHDDSCWVSVLTCGLEEGEEHSHSAECWTKTLICGMEEHVHGDACYAELPPAPELTEALAAPTEVATDAPYVPPVEDDVPAPSGEDPAPVELPEIPAEPGEDLKPEPVEEPVVTDPAEEPVDEPVEEPVVTEPEVTEPEVTEPLDERSLELLEHDAFVEMRLLILKDIIQSVEFTDSIDFPDVGIDLAPYIESAIFQHEIGGALVEDTYFLNGETAKATIIYDIPHDVVTPDSKYVYYQLPEGVRPIEETSGEVMDNGVPVGVYTITVDGMIHILFNDEFANGNAIIGTVEFFSWLYANDDSSDRVVEFENEAGTITIHVPDEQRYDLQLEKFGEFNADYTAAAYTLTISSEKGTGAPIQTVDVLTNQTPATLFSAVYNHTLAVKRVAADGTETMLENVNVTWAPDGMSFTVDELPALEAGERYELTYTVALSPDLSASFELDNEATAVAGPLEATTSFFISYTCDITKTGAFNPVTGLIDWVITINPESHPVAGWYIEDNLPLPAVGKVLLTTANGTRIADLTPDDGIHIKYTFPPTAPARPYFIRYSTAAPTSTGSVRNTVTLKYDGHETSSSSEVTVQERAEGVEKTAGDKHMDPNGMLHTCWNLQVTLPVGELTGYTFRDLISTPVMDVNNEMYLDSSLHFSYASEMEAAFRGNLRLVSEGVEYRYGDEENTYVNFNLTYYDAQGNTVEPDDDTTHVARVVFNVTPLNGNTFHGYEIVADNYPTWLDTSGAQEGDYWCFENDLYLSSGLFDRATSFYRKGKAFQKQILTPYGYTGDDNYVDYSECDGELQYRLLLDLTAMAGEEFTVTDLLPAGMEFVEGSARVFYTTANLHGEYDGTFSQDGTFSMTAEPGADGTTLLTFHGAGVTTLMKQTYAYIGIVYRVRLTDETLWNDYTHHQDQFTNSAAWGSNTDDHTVTVENYPKTLEKDGVQLVDEGGNPLNRVRFTLEINLGEEDLDPESDRITLVDVLNASSSLHPEIDRQSVAIYHYNPTKPDHLGNRLMNEEFEFSYNESNHRITVTLNDETAYVLVYDYIVDSNAILSGQTKIANAATLAGVFHASSEVVLQGVYSSATAYQRVVTVTKVDEKNQSKVLPGAEFSLERWDVDAQEWVTVTDAAGVARTYISDQHGKIVLGLIGEDHDIDLGILYRLTETHAPVGYEEDNTMLFFICEPRENGGEEEVLAAAGAGSGLTLDEVEIFGWEGGSCHITNRFSGLIIHKRWFAASGEEMDGNDRDPITVRLYASTDPSGLTEPVLVEPTEYIENPVILGPDNDWSYTWGSLPTIDDDGNIIYYFVAEDPVPGFTPVYINNGVCGGSIVISNNSEPFELPETGSNGNQAFIVLGVLLILLATVVYIRNLKMEVTK